MTTREPTPASVPPLGGKIMDGALWNTLQLLAARGTSLLVKLILARLLLPEDFGIVGMAAVFIDVIAAVSDLGLAAALIQFKKKKTTPVHFDTAFWISLAFSGGVVLLLIFAIGPFAVWFYNEPLLSTIIPILGFGTFLQSFSLIHRVILTRDLRFKPLGLTEAAASLVSGLLAIGLALAGAGVWALVSQDIGYVLISVPLLWRAISWRPHWRFSRAAFEEIFSAGLYDTLLRLVNYFTKNIDYLLVGKLLGPELLGIYTLAFVLTDTFRQQIWAVLSNVMFPVYAQVQDDIARVKDYYLKVIKYNTLVVVPIMLLLIYYPEPLIRHLFGERWLPAVFPIRMMAISAIVLTIGGTTGSVLKGLGRFDLNLRINLAIVFLVAAPAFFIGIYFYGINGAALAVLVYQTISRILFQYYMERLIGVHVADILAAIKTPLVGALSTLPILYVALTFLPEPGLFALAALVLATELLYGVVVTLLDKEEFLGLFRLFTQRLKIGSSS